MKKKRLDSKETGLIPVNPSHDTPYPRFEDSFQICPNEQWSKAISETEELKMDHFISSSFWKNQLNVIDRPQADKENFLHYFQDRKAEKIRQRSSLGVRRYNELEMTSLMQSAASYYLDIQDNHKDKDKDYLISKAFDIAFRFSSLVANGDHRDFTDMAKIKKFSGSAKPGEGIHYEDYKKDFNESLKPKILYQFCSIAISKRDLPTNKEVRESMGIRYDDKVKSNKYNEAIKDLGFKGLPTT